MISCFRCSNKNANKTCIVSRELVCENLIKCDNVDHCDVGCSDYYRCNNGSCVNIISTVCNGNFYGCEEDKQWISGPGFKCFREGNECNLPQQFVMDGIQDCDDGQDLCFEMDVRLLNRR